MSLDPKISNNCQLPPTGQNETAPISAKEVNNASDVNNTSNVKQNKVAIFFKTIGDHLKTAFRSLPPAGSNEM